MEELLNNQYMQFDLVPNQKVYVSNRMGAYFVSQLVDNSVSTFLLSNYDQVITYGIVSGDLTFESVASSLYITYTGTRDVYPIKVIPVAFK